MTLQGKERATDLNSKEICYQRVKLVIYEEERKTRAVLGLPIPIPNACVRLASLARHRGNVVQRPLHPFIARIGHP